MIPKLLSYNKGWACVCCSQANECFELRFAELDARQSFAKQAHLELSTRPFIQLKKQAWDHLLLAFYYVTYSVTYMLKLAVSSQTEGGRLFSHHISSQELVLYIPC